MTSLKSLNFTTLPKADSNPTADRRLRTIARLEEQKLLLRDANFVRKVRSFAKKDGVRTSIESDQRVLPWWRKNIDGSYLFSIKSGSKSIEFEKGKAAISVPSLDKLPTVIDTLIAATRSGELDTQLAQVSRTPPTRKKVS
ncbi:DUF6641 family protein [Afipia sp. DC4300-2b1]|uniref:DUF6641 family protein n=1 Tax=Afipia sp. DC4300-2b1 TaxID=2804672 RepID=UPI003CEBC904